MLGKKGSDGGPLSEVEKTVLNYADRFFHGPYHLSRALIKQLHARDELLWVSCTVIFTGECSSHDNLGRPRKQRNEAAQLTGDCCWGGRTAGRQGTIKACWCGLIYFQVVSLPVLLRTGINDSYSNTVAPDFEERIILNLIWCHRTLTNLVRSLTHIYKRFVFGYKPLIHLYQYSLIIPKMNP